MATFKCTHTEVIGMRNTRCAKYATMRITVTDSGFPKPWFVRSCDEHGYQYMDKVTELGATVSKVTAI